MSKLTAMSKDGDIIGVHPTLVEAHEKLGWEQSGEIAAAPAQELAGDDLASLRADYEAKFGKRPFMGWGVEELQNRIAAARSL